MWDIHRDYAEVKDRLKMGYLGIEKLEKFLEDFICKLLYLNLKKQGRTL